MKDLDRFPRELLIKVTQEIADTNRKGVLRGVQNGRCASCPLALAMNEALGDEVYAIVGSYGSVYSRTVPGGSLAEYSFPDGGLKYIGIADRHMRGEKGAPAPEPAEFMLTRVR